MGVGFYIVARRSSRKTLQCCAFCLTSKEFRCSLRGVSTCRAASYCRRRLERAHLFEESCPGFGFFCARTDRRDEKKGPRLPILEET